MRIKYTLKSVKKARDLKWFTWKFEWYVISHKAIPVKLEYSFMSTRHHPSKISTRKRIDVHDFVTNLLTACKMSKQKS